VVLSASVQRPTGPALADTTSVEEARA